MKMQPDSTNSAIIAANTLATTSTSGSKETKNQPWLSRMKDRQRELSTKVDSFINELSFGKQRRQLSRLIEYGGQIGRDVKPESMEALNAHIDTLSRTTKLGIAADNLCGRINVVARSLTQRPIHPILQSARFRPVTDELVTKIESAKTESENAQNSVKELMREIYSEFSIIDKNVQIINIDDHKITVDLEITDNIQKEQFVIETCVDFNLKCIDHFVANNDTAKKTKIEDLRRQLTEKHAECQKAVKKYNKLATHRETLENANNRINSWSEQELRNALTASDGSPPRVTQLHNVFTSDHRSLETYMVHADPRDPKNTADRPTVVLEQGNGMTAADAYILAREISKTYKVNVTFSNPSGVGESLGKEYNVKTAIENSKAKLRKAFEMAGGTPESLKKMLPMGFSLGGGLMTQAAKELLEELRAEGKIGETDKYDLLINMHSFASITEFATDIVHSIFQPGKGETEVMIEKLENISTPTLSINEKFTTPKTRAHKIHSFIAKGALKLFRLPTLNSLKAISDSQQLANHVLVIASTHDDIMKGPISLTNHLFERFRDTQIPQTESGNVHLVNSNIHLVNIEGLSHGNSLYFGTPTSLSQASSVNEESIGYLQQKMKEWAQTPAPTDEDKKVLLGDLERTIEEGKTARKDIEATISNTRDTLNKKGISDDYARHLEDFKSQTQPLIKELKDLVADQKSSKSKSEKEKIAGQIEKKEKEANDLFVKIEYLKSAVNKQKELSELDSYINKLENKTINLKEELNIQEEPPQPVYADSISNPQPPSADSSDTQSLYAEEMRFKPLSPPPISETNTSKITSEVLPKEELVDTIEQLQTNLDTAEWHLEQLPEHQKGKALHSEILKSLEQEREFLKSLSEKTELNPEEHKELFKHRYNIAFIEHKSMTLKNYKTLTDSSSIPREKNLLRKETELIFEFLIIENRCDERDIIDELKIDKLRSTFFNDDTYQELSNEFNRKCATPEDIQNQLENLQTLVNALKNKFLG